MRSWHDDRNRRRTAFQAATRQADRAGPSVCSSGLRWTGFVERRCRELGLPDEAAYQELVIQDADEMERLVQEVSVAETWFFRYPASFRSAQSITPPDLWREQSRNAADAQHRLCDRRGTVSHGDGRGRKRVGHWTASPSTQSIVTKRRWRSPATACYRSNSFREPMPPGPKNGFSRGRLQTRVDARRGRDGPFSLPGYPDRPCYLATRQPTTSSSVAICSSISTAQLARSWSTFSGRVLAPDGMLFVGHAEYAILPHESFASAGVQTRLCPATQAISRDHAHHDPPFASRSIGTASASPPNVPRGRDRPPGCRACAASAPRGANRLSTMPARWPTPVSSMQRSPSCRTCIRPRQASSICSAASNSAWADSNRPATLPESVVFRAQSRNGAAANGDHLRSTRKGRTGRAISTTGRPCSRTERATPTRGHASPDLQDSTPPESLIRDDETLDGAAILRLLDKPLSADDLREPPNAVARPLELAEKDVVRLLVFQVGEELMAFESVQVNQVTRAVGRASHSSSVQQDHSRAVQPGRRVDAVRRSGTLLGLGRSRCPSRTTGRHSGE